MNINLCFVPSDLKTPDFKTQVKHYQWGMVLNFHLLCPIFGFYLYLSKYIWSFFPFFYLYVHLFSKEEMGLAGTINGFQWL